MASGSPNAALLDVPPAGMPRRLTRSPRSCRATTTLRPEAAGALAMGGPFPATLRVVREGLDSRFTWTGADAPRVP
jgi:hypothetical protein